MSPSDRRDPQVSPADVVLGELGPESRADAERRMRDDPAFAAEVARLREVEAALSVVTPDDVPVPPLDIGAALHERPARGRAARPRWAGFGGGITRVPRPALAAAAVVLLFGGGVAVGTALNGGSGAPDTPTVVQAPNGPQVTLNALDDAGAQRAVAVMPGQSDGEMELRVENAAPSKPGEYYELWLLDDRRTTPIGTFRVGADGTAQVRFPLAIDPSSYRYLDVSVESDDGDPTHSGASVLRSPALS